HVLKKTTLGSSELMKVLACPSQAKVGIRPASYLLGVVVVLAIILPKAHRTNLVATSLQQRPAAATRTTIEAPVIHSLLCDVGKRHGVPRLAKPQSGAITADSDGGE